MTTAVDISHLDLTNKVRFGEKMCDSRLSNIFQGTYSGDDNTNHQVAIRILRIQGYSGPSVANERLLKHPNITPLFGYMSLPHELYAASRLPNHAKKRPGHIWSGLSTPIKMVMKKHIRKTSHRNTQSIPCHEIRVDEKAASIALRQMVMDDFGLNIGAIDIDWWG